MLGEDMWCFEFRGLHFPGGCISGLLIEIHNRDPGAFARKNDGYLLANLVGLKMKNYEANHLQYHGTKLSNHQATINTLSRPFAQ